MSSGVIDKDVAARTVTLMSANKAFNIAGLGMAFAHFGSTDLRKRFARLPPHIRGGNNVLAHAAVRAAWGQAQPWLDAVLEQLRANRDRVAAWCRDKHPAIGFLPPEATYLAWLDMRSLELPGTPHEFFLEQGKVAPGDVVALCAIATKKPEKSVLLRIHNPPKVLHYSPRFAKYTVRPILGMGR